MIATIYAHQRLENTDMTRRDFGEADHYFPAEFEDASGETRPLLLTADQIGDAMDRANRNPQFTEIAERDARKAERVVAYMLASAGLGLLALGYALGAAFGGGS